MVEKKTNSWIRSFAIQESKNKDEAGRREFLEDLRSDLENLITTRAFCLYSDSGDVLFESNSFGENEPNFLSSTIYYGLNQNNLQVGSDLDAEKLGEDIKRAIQHYEPRIDSNSLMVEHLEDSDSKGTLSISFSVTAKLSTARDARINERIHLDVGAASCSLDKNVVAKK